MLLRRTCNDTVSSHCWVMSCAFRESSDVRMGGRSKVPQKASPAPNEQSRTETRTQADERAQELTRNSGHRPVAVLQARLHSSISVQRRLTSEHGPAIVRTF